MAQGVVILSTSSFYLFGSDSQEKQISAMKRLRILFLMRHILLGTLLLCGFSVLQKLAVGVDPLLPRGYLIPLFFGAIAGLLYGMQMLRIQHLNALLSERVHTLEALLPVCSYCKKIRIESENAPEGGLWKNIEDYFHEKTQVEFSHSLCPDCLRVHQPEFYEDHFLRGLSR